MRGDGRWTQPSRVIRNLAGPANRGIKWFQRLAPSKVYSVVIRFAARRGVTVVSVVVCNLMDVRTTPCLAQELGSHWGIEEQHKNDAQFGTIE